VLALGLGRNACCPDEVTCSPATITHFCPSGIKALTPSSVPGPMILIGPAASRVLGPTRKHFRAGQMRYRHCRCGEIIDDLQRAQSKASMQIAD
jgi:hypothetical protein